MQNPASCYLKLGQQEKARNFIYEQIQDLEKAYATIEGNKIHLDILFFRYETYMMFNEKKEAETVRAEHL